MEEEILEKKPSNPVESVLLVITAISLCLGIFMGWTELSEYLRPDDNFEMPVEERIQEKAQDSKLKKLKKQIEKEKENYYQFISSEGSSGQKVQ